MLFSNSLFGARLVEPCEVQFLIQDGDIGENIILEVVFDDKCLEGEKGTFYEQKKARLMVSEGIHTIRWKVRKRDFGRDANIVETIEKKLEIEKFDSICYISIRGKSIVINSNSSWKDKGL
jgi:hypothetical protein